MNKFEPSDNNSSVMLQLVTVTFTLRVCGSEAVIPVDIKELFNF